MFFLLRTAAILKVLHIVYRKRKQTNRYLNASSSHYLRKVTKILINRSINLRRQNIFKFKVPSANGFLRRLKQRKIEKQAEKTIPIFLRWRNITKHKAYFKTQQY